jgi:hypothetical protein
MLLDNPAAQRISDNILSLYDKILSLHLTDELLQFYYFFAGRRQ